MNIYHSNFLEEIAEFEGQHYLQMMKLPCYLGRENGLFNKDGSLNRECDRPLHGIAGMPRYWIEADGSLKK